MILLQGFVFKRYFFLTRHSVCRPNKLKDTVSKECHELWPHKYEKLQNMSKKNRLNYLIQFHFRNAFRVLPNQIIQSILFVPLKYVASIHVLHVDETCLK